MGYGSHTPQLFTGLRRFTDHVADGNTVALWTFDKDDTDQVGVFDQNTLSNVCYAPAFGFSDDKRATLACNWTTNYGVNPAVALKALTSITVACWYCPNLVPGGGAASLVGFRAPGAGSGDPNTHNFPWDLNHQASGELKWVWQHGDKLDSAMLSPVLALNEWVHVIATRSAAEDAGRVYLNGALAASATGLTAHAGGSSINTLRFGGDGTSNGLRGLLGTSIIKNVEITDVQAAALYRETLVY